MSARRAGSIARSFRRSRTSCVHSCMLGLRDVANGGDEALPSRALDCQDLAAGRGQPVIAAAPLASLLDPATLNPAALLQAIEQRIERGDAEPYGAVRPRFDDLADLVAVAWPVLDERQDQHLGAALFQLAIEDLRMLHSDILL